MGSGRVARHAPRRRRRHGPGGAGCRWCASAQRIGGADADRRRDLGDVPRTRVVADGDDRNVARPDRACLAGDRPGPRQPAPRSVDPDRAGGRLVDSGDRLLRANDRSGATARTGHHPRLVGRWRRRRADRTETDHPCIGHLAARGAVRAARRARRDDQLAERTGRLPLRGAAAPANHAGSGSRSAGRRRTGGSPHRRSPPPCRARLRAAASVPDTDRVPNRPAPRRRAIATAVAASTVLVTACFSAPPGSPPARPTTTATAPASGATARPASPTPEIPGLSWVQATDVERPEDAFAGASAAPTAPSGPGTAGHPGHFPGQAIVDDVARVGEGLVAVGYVGMRGAWTALAWTSDDEDRWDLATIDPSPGSFAVSVAVGHGAAGRIVAGGRSGGSPVAWDSTDGRHVDPADDPDPRQRRRMGADRHRPRDRRGIPRGRLGGTGARRSAGPVLAFSRWGDVVGRARRSGLRRRRGRVDRRPRRRVRRPRPARDRPARNRVHRLGLR